MGRAKQKLELIPNSRTRRITFEKRKKGLMKKAEEFRILCGVDTCMIMYPMGMSGDGPVQPEIWPPDNKEVERIVRRYQSEAANRRAKHATGLCEFFASRKKKIEAELAKTCEANWKAKYPISDKFLKDLSEPQLRSLLSAVGDRLEQAKTRLAIMKEKRRAKTVVPSDWIIPSGGVDLHPSNAGFMQDWVVQGGLPFEFLYQEDEEKRRVEASMTSDMIVPSGGVDLNASNAGSMQDGAVEAGLPFEFLCQLDKEKRRVEDSATSDWVVPSGGADLHASNAGFMQERVVEAGLPLSSCINRTVQSDQSMIIRVPHRLRIQRSSDPQEVTILCAAPSMKLRA